MLSIIWVQRKSYLPLNTPTYIPPSSTSGYYFSNMRCLWLQGTVQCLLFPAHTHFAGYCITIVIIHYSRIPAPRKFPIDIICFYNSAASTVKVKAALNSACQIIQFWSASVYQWSIKISIVNTHIKSPSKIIYESISKIKNKFSNNYWTEFIYSLSKSLYISILLSTIS